MFQAKFSKKYIIVHLRVSPEDIGWPVSRRRLYVMCFLRSKYRWCGPDDMCEVASLFRSLCGRRVCSDCDVFLGDEPCNVRRRVQQIAGEQGLYVSKGHELDIDPADILCQSSKKHYRLYEQKYQRLLRGLDCEDESSDEDCGESERPSRMRQEAAAQAAQELLRKEVRAFPSDLYQNPASRDVSRANGIMPALTCRTCRYSHSRARFYTWAELYSCHGWPSLPSYCADRTMPSLEGLDSTTQGRMLHA